MRKKRILAGIMSLLLIFTSVFAGNVEVRAATPTVINEDTSVNSTVRYDELVVKSEKTLTISGTTGESEPVVVTIGNTLTVEEGGSVVASNNAVLELLDGATASGIDLYSESGSPLSENGNFKNQSGDFMAFDWDGNNSKWILHVESWEPSYDEFNPDKTNNLYMVELKNCNASCGSVSFGTTVEASKVNPEDGDMSKSRFQGNTVIISFTPVGGQYVDRISIGTTEYRPGNVGFVLPSNMSQDGETFTYTTLGSDFDENGYLYIEVGFTGGSNGAISYGKDGSLEFNIANPDKGDVLFQIGDGTKYCVGGNAQNPESSIQEALKDTTLQATNTIKVWAEKSGGKIVGNFDIKIDGTSVFTTDNERTAARTAAESTEGYTFTVPTGYESTKRIEFAIEFRDETPSGGNGTISYGKDGILEFNIANPDKGDVFFQIGDGTKYCVGGNAQNPESSIQEALKDTTLQATNTIKVWAEKSGGKIVGNFDIKIDGTSVFTTDNERTAARTAAESTEGYTFTVPTGYESTKRIEFAIEFRDETPSGGNGTISYGKDGILEFNITNPDKGDVFFQIGGKEKYCAGGTEQVPDATIQEALKDTTLAAGSTIKVWSEKRGGNIVGNFDIRIDGTSVFSTDNERTAARTAAESTEGYTFTVPTGYESTKRIEFAIEFRDETSGGGEEFPWYTVSYGNSANLTTSNGQVYAERVHVGDITYSSIASEYNESTTDKIYSMEETIFHQKTPEEEKDPNYKDALTRYGIGGSDGDIFIRSDVSGVSIDFKFIPDFGYQLTNIYTNENETESLLNKFTAAEAVSSFTFDVIQGGNVHFEVKFEKVDNKVTGNAGFASSAKIESANAATSGTLEMTVDNATASNAIPSGSEALAAYDITLKNVVSKGGDRGSWDTPLADLGDGKVATVTLPVDDTDSTNYTYTVIREHEGIEDTLKATVTDGAISFDTNKFSTYTIVKTPIIRSIKNAEITLGDALTYNGAQQTQAIANVMVDGRTLTEGIDYEVTGNTGTDAKTYILTITGQGHYTGTETKDWSIGQKSISSATITLGADLTYNGTTQTQAVSSVVIDSKILTADTEYSISGNAQKDAGTYTLTVTGNGNYEGTVTKEFTISKATLAPTLSGTTTKVYDNTITVTAKDNLNLSVTGLQNSETVTVTATGYAYDNANVGTGKTITASGITISGDAAKNYVLSGTTATVAGGEITKATPTITLSNLTETTKAPTGVKATLSPADATAVVKIEYQVADGQWVTTRPTEPGTYKVRAYLPNATTNLAAVGVENAVTSTYTLTKYTASSGGGSNNNSGTGSGSSSGSTSSDTTTTNTPVLVETVTATETTTTNKTTQPTKVVTPTKTPSKTEEKTDAKLVLPYQQAKDEPVSGTLQVSFGEGTVKVNVESRDEKGNAKGDGIIGVTLGSFDNVLNAVLTAEEKNEVKAGKNVEVRLSMKKLTQEIPAAEKTAMEELVAQKSTQISGLTIGTYMDISMEKKLGNKDWKKLTNLNEEVEITIDVPEDLQMAGAQYWVVKNHNGEVSLLEDLDNKEDTVTIKSGEFSTYAIAYAVSNVEDVDADGVESVEDVPVEEVQTQETGLAWYWWLLPVAVLVIAIVGYTVYKKNSSDEE